MELKSYQRAFLRSKAQALDPVVYVGKEGLTEGVINAPGDIKGAGEGHSLDAHRDNRFHYCLLPSGQ